MGRKGTGVELRDKSIRVGFVLDGQWVRETIRIPPTPGNERYAVRLVHTINERIRAGTFDYAEFFPDSPRAKAAATASLTLGDAADLYVKSIGQLSEATRSQYGNAVKVWRTILDENKPLASFTHSDLKTAIGGHPWKSPKLLNNHLIPLRGIFALQYHGADALRNPLIGIENGKVVQKKPDPFTPTERDLILAHIEANYDERYYLYFVVAFYSGLRPEELIALRWGDIDWLYGTMHIQRVRTFKGSERDGSKTHTERDVDMVEAVINALTRMKKHTFLKGADADVFENPNTGRPFHDDRSQREHCFAPTLKRLGIRARSAYKTRATYATMALMGGVDPNYVARQLGHTNTRMLFDKYAKWIDGADKGAQRAKMNAAAKTQPPDIDAPQKTGT